MIGIASRGLLRIPRLSSFLGESVKRLPGRPWPLPKGLTALGGWGHKPNAVWLLKRARGMGIPYLAIEDGFLRSVGLGVLGAPPLSLVVDDLGIYYDATRASRLERLIAESGTQTAELDDAIRALGLIRKFRLSKYNHAPEVRLPAKDEGQSRVLVVDQTAGDMSLVLGGADQGTFDKMLNAAKIEHPSAEIWIKTHPDVLMGKKRGHFDPSDPDLRVRFLEEDGCPLSILEQFDHVYVATSQMGFEALMLGKSVTCFGQPWYAGWGLTNDRHPDIGALRVRRPGSRSLEQLFDAAYLRYARYVSPTSGKRCTLFEIIEWLARNKAINNDSRGTFVCIGMSYWKRAVATPFLRTPSSRLQYARTLSPGNFATLPADSRLVVWGSQQHELCTVAERYGMPVIRLEDGFIRSSGLGSDLHGALSLAVDGPGIYYDPNSASRLEILLSKADVQEVELARAAQLRYQLTRLKVSKYNVGGSFHPSQRLGGKRILLVPGQVEDDSSIRTGSPMISRNRDLLAAVRKANPDAWIIYKPHPDVEAGNRQGVIPADLLKCLADEVASQANISYCIAAADEVHTMTSLAGFEALLCGKIVHCYGGPFYAGWGLTVDHILMPRRQRRLSIDELVFVALCQYPRYRLPGINGFCAVEDVIDHLVSRQRCGDDRKVGSHWLGRQWRKARQLVSVFATAR